MIAKIKKLATGLSLLLLLSVLSIYAQKADLVAFSYNRPIQLYALLESVETYIEGLEEIHVVYRSTDDKYEDAYQEVKHDFPYVIFHKQGKNPRQDFKPLTLKASFESPSQYILFAVDDIIVKDYIDIEKDIELLKSTEAYGVYFRLGLNLDRCYALNRSQKTPPVKPVIDDVYLWNFSSGQCDWNYPNTVDMTLYKKDDIKQAFIRMGYNAPNSLEARWSTKRNREKPFGLCYEETKIVNLPLNRVQNTHKNRNMNALSAKELLEIFNNGLKIDIALLFKVKNRAAHMDYVPEFIER